MATQEFYIRNEAETEARGPFNIEQLVSLAAAGQVTNETLCYDAATEAWGPLANNQELKAAVFPEKNKLVMKKDLKIATLNKPAEHSAPITVDDMLAAAEGKTPDTKGRSDPKIAMARAARIGMWAAVLALLAAAAGEVLPAADAIQSLNWNKLIAQPLVILGALDLFLAVLLGMGAVGAYPFVRFRAALGIGFVGFIFYVQGFETPLIAAVAGAVGLYFCTILTNTMTVLLAALAAIAGMAGMTYFLLSV
jgi:GYF domain 2